MTEISQDTFETFHLPKEREFSPNDIDPSIAKLGSKVTHILIEMPQDDAKAIPVDVRHAMSDLDTGKVIGN